MTENEARQLTRKRFGAVAVAFLFAQVLSAGLASVIRGDQNLISDLTIARDGSAYFTFVPVFVLAITVLVYFLFGWLGLVMRTTVQSIAFQARHKNKSMLHLGWASNRFVLDWLFPGLK